MLINKKIGKNTMKRTHQKSARDCQRVSAYRRWLSVNLPLGPICQTLEDHNRVMSQQKVIIRPQGEINFPLGGMAFTYAFRWKILGDPKYWVPDTVAWGGLQQAGLGESFLAHFRQPSGLGSMLLAEFDGACRANMSGALLERSVGLVAT